MAENAVRRSSQSMMICLHLGHTANGLQNGKCGFQAMTSYVLYFPTDTANQRTVPVLNLGQLFIEVVH